MLWRKYSGKKASKLGVLSHVEEMPVYQRWDTAVVVFFGTGSKAWRLRKKGHFANQKPMLHRLAEALRAGSLL